MRTANTTLVRIIRSTALAQRDSIEVEINRGHSWVTIRDLVGGQEDIFLQGEEAETFIDEADTLWSSAEVVEFDQVLLHLAAPYAENLWH